MAQPFDQVFDATLDAVRLFGLFARCDTLANNALDQIQAAAPLGLTNLLGHGSEENKSTG